MQPRIFTYCFTIKAIMYLRLLEFFLYIDVMMAKSIVDPMEQNTQEFLEVNTLLNLFNN